METLHTSLTNELVEIAGKGGGGGGHTPVEADDTLGSRQTLRLLIAVSEGPIHSIDDVLLNNVSYTQYPDVSIETRLGTADQTVIPGFTSVETTHSPFQPTTLSAGTVQGTNPVEYLTTFTHDVSAARVTMLCPSLVQATSQGDRVGYSVSYAIAVRPISSSIWQTVVSDTISGKGSNISWDVRVAQPAASTGNWQIKVTRTSADDTSDMLHSVLAVQHITDLIDSAETYPYTALIGITVKNANLFGNTEPAVTVIAKGMTYYLPYGYDATARTYPTVWTGNFKVLREYTDNPAWAIYYSITTNPDGTPLKWSRNIPRSYVDTGAFYNLAKYCDGLVPDGKGGMEPRFRIDLQYIDRSNIPTYFAALCSVCNAKLVPNNFGQISITWDNPSAAIKHLETNSTVINGKFKYSSNDTEERYNHVTCTFSDRDQLGNTNMAVLQEQSLIDRNGIIPHDLVLQGCTRYSQALRKARYTFWVSSKDTSVITFNKLFGGLTYVAGELIKVLDSDMVSQTPLTAMIIAQQTNGTNTILTLDTSVTLANEQYSIAAPATDGVTIIENAIIETNVTTNVVTVTTNANFFIGAPIIFSATTISAKIFKVLGIKKSEESYEVMAVLHSMERYAYIESANPIPLPEDSGMFGTFTQYAVNAVSNIQVSAFYAENNLKKSAILTVTWDYADDFALKFRPQFGITYSRDGLPSVTQSGFFDRSFDIHDAVPGNYKIQVWAINSVSGVMSVSTFLYYDYYSTAATSTLLPPTDAYVTGTLGQTWSGRDLQFYWIENSANATAQDKLSKYILEIWNNANTSILQTIPVVPNKENAQTTGEFKLTLEHNTVLFTTPNPIVNFKIFCEDLVGNRSTARAITFTNQAPIIGGFTPTAGFGYVALKAVVDNYDDIVSFTFKKYANAEILSPIASVTVTTNTYDFPADEGVEYWFTAQAKDFYRYGDETTRINKTSVPTTPDTYTYTGLQFKPNDPAVNYVSWTAFNAIKNGTTTDAVEADNVQWTAGTLYLYYVPGTTALQATTDSLTAIEAKGRILATYKGGTVLTADAGRAFIDGDQIIAGSLLANALAADTAYIAHAAQFGDILESNTYSWGPVTYDGWRLFKNGTARFKDIEIRNDDGDLLLSSGTGMEWSYVTGTTRPVDNATRNVFTGNWATATNYIIGDIVLDAYGYGWSCIVAHTSSASNVTPTYPTSSNAYWTLYAVKGADGASAKYVIITGEQAFKFAAGSSTPTNTTITLTAVLYGGLTTYDWEYWDSTSSAWVNLTGTQTNSTYNLAYNNSAWGTATSLRIRCLSGTYYDEITVVKLFDGAAGTNAISGYLTNEVHSEAAASNGTGYSLTNAGGVFKVYNGITDVTTSSSFAVTGGISGVKTQNGLTFTINATSGVYSLSGTSWTTDTESFTVTATYGGVTLTKLYSIDKAKQGIAGAGGISAILTNETHTFPADIAGAVSSYTNSGTEIHVYEGSGELAYDGVGTSNGAWKITTVATNITVGSLTDSGTYVTVGVASGVAAGTDVSSIVYTISGKTLAGVSFSFTKTQTFSKSKTGPQGAVGGTISLTSNRVASFTATDGTLDTSQTDITLTANLLNISSATYAWTFAGFQTAPTASTTNTQTITSAQFGTSKGAKVTCTVTAGGVTYTDDMSVVRLEKSTAAAGATVGAAFDTNISGQITASNASTYIADAAIGSAQITDAAITNAKIDRASVNKLQVVTADIVDANVSTLKIAGNAVTVPTIFTHGSGSIGYAPGVFDNIILEESFTAYGGIQYITYALKVGNSKMGINLSGLTTYCSDVPILLRLYIDSVKVYQTLWAWTDSVYAISQALSIGTHTIQVSLQYGFNTISGLSPTGVYTACEWASGTVFIQEAKR